MSLFSKFFKKPDVEKEEKFREELEESGGVEKKDIPAMIMSAYLIFIPVAVIILLLFCFVAWMFLGFI